ncbi:hypothetical protein, partial [Microvirga sp. HBU67558]|uniref:hypothetical protein n=1 Tax=Microvirga sp. HBU67558 TaxID=2824562 RepID=UPI001FFC2F05
MTGFLKPCDSLRIAAGHEVSISNAGIGVENHGIKWAQTDGPLEVVNPGSRIIAERVKPPAAVPCPGRVR